MGGTPASFGYWVRRRRLALDLTRDALARRVGCSPSALKKFERDERRPSRTMATRLAEALGVPPDQGERFVAAALACSTGLSGPPTAISSLLISWPGRDVQRVSVERGCQGRRAKSTAAAASA